MNEMLDLNFDPADLGDDLIFGGEGEGDNFFDTFQSLLADEDEPASSKQSGDNGKGGKRRAAAPKASKKRKLNPDAANITSCTEAALKELEIDPDSEEAKKMRRQIRNRLSAQFHRDRKNLYIKELEEKVAEKERLIEALRLELAKAKEENEALKASAARLPLCRDRAASYLGLTDSDSSVSLTPEHEPSSLFSHSHTYAHPQRFADSPPQVFSSFSLSSAAPLSAQTSSAAMSAAPSTMHNAAPLAYPRIMSAPLIKSLSVLSVICLLCLSGMAPNGISVGDGSRVITRESVLESGIVDELLVLRDEAVAASSSAAAPTSARRRLEIVDLDRPLELNQSLSAKLLLPAHIDETERPKFHLRREENTGFNASFASLAETPALPMNRIFVSRESVRFDTLSSHAHTHAQGQQWFASHAFESQSFSHIALSQGFALFDPSLRMGESPTAAMRSPGHHLSLVPSPAAQFSSKIAQQPLPSVAPRGLLAAPHMIESEREESTSMDVEDEHEERSSEESSVQSKSIMPLHNNAPWPVVGSTSCEADRQAALAKFLSGANLVTVTLPASSVRMGKSLSESQSGTVESIVRLFNLTALDDNAMSMDQESTSNASVEISCLLLGAKLVVGSANLS